MPFDAHKWTDDQIDALSVRMHEMYAQAANEMQDKLDAWLREYERENKGWQAAVKNGLVSKSEYQKWLSDRAMERQWQTNMINQLATDAVSADARARQLINDEVPTVFAENANAQAYEICRATGLDLAFTLYNQDAVRFLLTDPKIYPTIDVAKDAAWNQQKMASAITQGILQGESVPNVASRLRKVLAMDERAATLAARTTLTYVESRGRQDSMRRAVEMGIPVKQVWKALHDGRTRHEHRQMDEVAVEIGEKFDVDGHKMTGPGDPEGPGYLVYNCRCRVRAEVAIDDIPPRVVIGRDKFPKDVTYEQWKSGTYRTDKFGAETKDSKRERGIE